MVESIVGGKRKASGKNNWLGENSINLNFACLEKGVPMIAIHLRQQLSLKARYDLAHNIQDLVRHSPTGKWRFIL